MLYGIAISTDAGIEVWSHNEEGSPYSLLDPQLISGFMTAIQNFSESVIKSSVNEIRFADLLVYIRTYGKFSVYLLLKEKVDDQIIPLLPSFQQAAIAFGVEYAVTIQKTWLSVLKGNWKSKTQKLTAKSFAIKRKSQSIELTLSNWIDESFPPELTNTLLTGFLEGILSTFEITAPTVIREERRYTTWEITF
jgi:hypothetical protein